MHLRRRVRIVFSETSDWNVYLNKIKVSLALNMPYLVIINKGGKIFKK